MRFSTILRQIRREKFILVVALIGLLLMVLSFVGPLVVQASPNTPNIGARLEAPTWAGGSGGFLGTDQLGRPMWMRLLYGLRTSYLIGFASVALGGVVGVTVGLVAGLYGGWVDNVIMRITDIQMALPALLLIMTIVAVVGGGGVTLVLALGLNSWMLYARVARSLVMTYRSTDFVLGAQATGAGPLRVLALHLLPNSATALVAVATLELPRLMIGEATMSFLGFGVQTPTVSLGLVISQGRDYLAHEWWVSTFAGLLLAIAVLSTNLVGNWLNRVTDPLQQGDQS